MYSERHSRGQHTYHDGFENRIILYYNIAVVVFAFITIYTRRRSAARNKSAHVNFSVNLE